MRRPLRPDRQRITQPLSEPWWLWLCGVKTWQQLVDEGADESLDIFILEGDEEREVHLWSQYREDVLRYVAEVTPGRRPPAWWRHEAPEPRRQVAGRTIRVWRKYARQQPSPWDLPSDWNDGEKGHWYEEPDPLDPPRYESEAAYLRRHKMLLPGEAARLKKADFNPVTTGTVEN